MNKKGFTLTEVIISSSIFTLVVAGTLAVYIMAMVIWKEASVHVKLQREGSLAIEKMVRGVNGRNGIREAESAEIYDSSTKISFKSGIDGKIRSFRLVNNDVIPTEDGTDGLPIAENAVISTGLQFTKVDNTTIAIALKLEQSVRNKLIKVNLSTKVKLRNS